ncbi:dipeptide/oligopeptide/nickel ABC transporter permease/ATP-binding protein [Amycolatopsis sp. NPDC004079]|uniref:dipeptide/oligopeptide/nickel ABC transporter permease/ATP-binding protein n=1 Tax=Amycolatopsis sp. NPDC004079 TaxID=3154549 RepID=UPI0033A44890
MSDVTALAARRPQRSAHAFRWTPGLVVGLGLMLTIVLAGILAPIFLWGPGDQLSSAQSLPPSGKHWLGTDEFGHDVLARALVATRLTLVLTVCATAIGVVFGVALGTAIWLAPRRIRELGLRAIEAAVSYPGLLVALIIAATFGAGAVPVVIGIGVAGIPAYARLTANLASDVSRRDFVTAARLLGVPGRSIVTRHLLPNVAEPLLILVASGFAVSLMEIAGLSLVGLGVQPPSYDYGKLLIDALPAIYSRPWQVLGPAVLIVVTILAAMLIGDGLAAAADPRTSASHRPEGKSRTAASAAATSSFVTVRDLRITTSAGVELVHGVSFDIPAGSVLGVVGESGSGKSMTAMALARLLPEGIGSDATALRVGTLDLLGQSSKRDLATTISLVYQDPGTTFSPALRMESQVGEVLRTHLGKTRAKARNEVLAAFETVRMRHPRLVLGQHPHELSGGMRQRAMIAAALTARPKLIIADEPTTALDVTVQAEILRQFKKINAREDTAMLFISHDIGVVEALCDNIIVMKDGEIVESLTRSQLVTRDVRHPYTKKLIAATPTLTDPLPERAR